MTEATAICRICGCRTSVLFASPSKYSILSSATLIQGSTIVDLCHSCGHAQTSPIVAVAEYYSKDYKFQMNDAGQDEIYDVAIDGTNIYRTDFQANVASTIVRFSPNMRVLDYGCGKARSLKIIKHRYAVNPFAFDVSTAYRETWADFVPPSNQACHAIPEDWFGSFDVVLTFFALEHVEQPIDFLVEINNLLVEGGQICLFVPNVLGNASDLLVADHVNHFSVASLALAMRLGGFENVEIDDGVFRGAFVVTGTRSKSIQTNMMTSVQKWNVQPVLDVAQGWHALAERIRLIEADETRYTLAAIYGSGVYGLFVAMCLQDLRRFYCFVDRNRFRHGLKFFDRPVVGPDDLPAEVDFIVVALSPKVAAASITLAPEALRKRNLFFI